MTSERKYYISIDDKYLLENGELGNPFKQKVKEFTEDEKRTIESIIPGAFKWFVNIDF